MSMPSLRIEEGSMSAQLLRNNIPASATFPFAVSESASVVCKQDAMLDVHFHEARVGLADSRLILFLQLSHPVTESEARALHRARLSIHRQP
jgi:hypothetical protein